MGVVLKEFTLSRGKGVGEGEAGPARGQAQSLQGTSVCSCALAVGQRVGWKGSSIGPWDPRAPGCTLRDS